MHNQSRHGATKRELPARPVEPTAGRSAPPGQHQRSKRQTLPGNKPVSYTHLDVYKRQGVHAKLADCEGYEFTDDSWIICLNYILNTQKTTIRDNWIYGDNLSVGAISPAAQMLKTSFLIWVSRKNTFP